jgi:pantoate--beta-alanine ligase
LSVCFDQKVLFLNVQIVKTSLEITEIQARYRKENSGLVIGFVPTMGALHDGHLSLIREARINCGLVVCSIFVNPTQFNDPKDLERYPRTLEADTLLLRQAGCDFLFVPDVTEVYPNGLNQQYNIDFQGIDSMMEGQFRPGHFKGVAMVVECLFNLVKPDMAFFGQKDFQQVAIIRKMVEVRKLPVAIRTVKTMRNADGLALSSRNMLLSEAEKNDALIIYKTLSKALEKATLGAKTDKIKSDLVGYFNSGQLKLEYLDIVSNLTLLPIDEVEPGCTCCIAAWCGKVRLIDNMELS